MAGAAAFTTVSAWGAVYSAFSSKLQGSACAEYGQPPCHLRAEGAPDISPRSPLDGAAAAATVGALASMAAVGTVTSRRRAARGRPSPSIVAMRGSYLGGTETTGQVTFGNGYVFNREDLMGSGAYGKVYKCKNRWGKEFAMKQVFAGGMEALKEEIESHKHVGKHENIVELVDVFDVPGITDKRIVMEMANGGELTELLQQKGKQTEAWAKGVFKQVVSAVAHMHNKNVMHRDLKTDNILLCEDRFHNANNPIVKVIDFGAAHWARTGPFIASKFIGTIQTMAPEVIISRGDDFDTTDPSQIEATHEIQFKKRPFGIRKYSPGPNGIGAKVKLVGEKPRYPGDPIGQAFSAAVQEGWAVKSVNGREVGAMTMDDIIDTMGDRLLDNSSRGAFDGSFKVTGDNKGKGKVEAKVEMVELPVNVVYATMKGKCYGATADVWSLGSILYNIVTGEPPFEPTEESVMAGVFKKPMGVSPALVDLLDKMLVVDPTKRASLAEVAAHPWLKWG